MTFALNLDELSWVSQCSFAKNMWDMLEVTHEGIIDARRARKHELIQEYELFKMQLGETIIEFKNRFTHIMNHLIGLEKDVDKK